MIRRHWRAILFGLVLLAGSIAPAAAQVQKGGGPSASPEATGGEPGCELIRSYTRELFTLIDNSGAFAEFFYTSDDWNDISPEFAADVREDGEDLLADVAELEVPGAYARGHEGIVMFFELQISVAHFYGIDTSNVPNLNLQDEAFALINEGELAVAEACPDEIDEVGGFILLEPEELPVEPADPESIPE